MTKEEAREFLMQTIEDGDTISFTLHQADPAPYPYNQRFHYSLYHGLLNIGSEVALLLHATPVNAGYFAKLVVLEDKNKQVITYMGHLTLLHALEREIGDLILDWELINEIQGAK